MIAPPVKPLLAMREVRKTFGGVVALDGVDLTVKAGEVHALIGENGAGKSTLMKVLSGAHAPDAGWMELDGEPYRPTGPTAARDRGVAMIYQELNLAPHLTVAQNIALGREPSTAGWVRSAAVRRDVERALRLLEHRDLDPDRPVAELGPGPRQMVEVARALCGDAKVIVMDEPTSSLSRRDTERLFGVIRRLREEGVSIIYISHFLEEVNEVGDRFTVLRDGRTVGSGELNEVETSQLIQLMVGRSLDEIFPRVEARPGAVALRVLGLAGERLPRRASFELRSGEILGVAGLVGAGRTEMLRALFGLDPIASGTVEVGGSADLGAGPAARLSRGVGMLSENRKEEGLLQSMSIAVNMTLSKLSPFTSLGIIKARRQREAVERLIERLRVRCDGASQRVDELSGGNQQKVAIARLLHHDVDVLLLDEPTRGIDVASKAEVYRLMGALKRQGKAILFVSSYVPELLGVCDRVAVMHRGQLQPARPVADWTEHEILDVASRGTS